MFCYSSVHHWQDNRYIKQILIFPSKPAMKHFEIEFEQRISEYGVDFATDTGIGAIYKIRSIRTENGDNIGMICCGVTASILVNRGTYGSHGETLFTLLRILIRDIISKQSNFSDESEIELIARRILGESMNTIDFCSTLPKYNY